LKKAAIYARFSSNNQRQESIFHQVEKIKQYANDNGIEIVETYVDEAESGTTDQRTNFLKMINDAQTASWKYIIVYKMDRLSRSVADALNYKKHLAGLGIRIVSVIEDFDTDTPEGGLFNLITMGLSQYYVENMKRETMAGIMQNAKTGRHSGGRAPLGYKVKDDLHYEIDPVGAEAVKIIFNMIEQRQTYTEITKVLKEKGYKTIEGNDFRPNFIDIVTNRKYLGEYVYNRTISKDHLGKRRNRLSKPESEIVRIKEAMPRIIEDEQFKRVQEIVASRKKGKFNTWAKSKYLLSGRTQCAICGKAIVGNVSFRTDERAPIMQYRCQTKGVNRCHLKSLNMINLDKFVVWFLKDVLLNEKNSKSLKLILEDKVNRIVENSISRQADIKNKISSIDDTLKVINGNLANSNKAMEKILYSEIKEAIIQREKHEIELESISSLNMPKVKYLNDLRTIISSFRKQIKDLNIENNKKAIAALIQRIKLNNESIIIHFSINPFVDSLVSHESIAFIIPREFVAWPGRNELSSNIDVFETINDHLN
jgi:site-specific DNA recombinase